MVSFIRDLARFRARRTPDREAVFDWESGIRYTWGDLEQRSTSMIKFLGETLGVRKGDVVGFVSPTVMQMVDVFLASFTLGYIIDTYNYRLKASELVSLAELEQPKVLFYSSAHYDKAKAIGNSLGESCVLVCLENMRELENGYTPSNAEPADVIQPIPPCEIEFDNPQMLIHTGGTTGLPKAGILSFRSIFMNAVSEIITCDLTHDDCAYIGMPLYHTAGWNTIMLPLLLSGGRIVVSKEFSADVFLDVVEQERPSVFLGTEAMFKMIVENPRFSKVDFSCFKWILGAGGPVSQATMEPFWNRGVKFFVGYGMTETGPNNIVPNVAESLEKNRAKPHSVGKPMAFTELRIERDDGEEAKVNEAGEILLRGALSFNGYWKRESETRQMFDGDWIRTGDIGTRDEDGDVRICGRLKNMYISGGENIFPIEAERCLEAHPAVREACVIGVPDARWGEVGKALIVTKDNCAIDLLTLDKYLRENLSSVKRPKYMEFVSAIPKNAIGKRDEAFIACTYGHVEQKLLASL